MKAFLSAFCLATCFVVPAQAQDRLEAARSCLTDHTTGKDRKLLGRWIFLAIAAHPEISGLSRANESDRDATSRQFAELFMRLLTEDCSAEVRELLAEGGSNALTSAFEFLGQVAMQELTQHERVDAALSGFERYLDNGALSAALTAPPEGAPEAETGN